MKKVILAITGASGAPIARRLLELLLQEESVQLSLLMSDNAREVFRAESGLDLGKTHDELRDALAHYFSLNDRFELHNVRDMAARISSGSHLNTGMIIAPCSMSTLGAIAHGITMNLIHRAASVMLKEKRELILVPRESPLSPIHLKNMLELCRIGVHIVPPTTAFYYRPQRVEDMVDFICMKVLDLAGIPHPLDKRWKGKAQSQNEGHQRIQRYLG